jgi:ATP-dependent protease Clp ATPase subunit
MGVEVEFTQEALHQVAKEAIQRNTVHALTRHLENVLMNIMFEVPLVMMCEKSSSMMP